MPPVGTKNLPFFSKEGGGFCNLRYNSLFFQIPIVPFEKLDFGHLLFNEINVL